MGRGRGGDGRSSTTTPERWKKERHEERKEEVTEERKEEVTAAARCAACGVALHLRWIWAFLRNHEREGILHHVDHASERANNRNTRCCSLRARPSPRAKCAPLVLLSFTCFDKLI